MICHLTGARQRERTFVCIFWEYLLNNTNIFTKASVSYKPHQDPKLFHVNNDFISRPSNVIYAWFFSNAEIIKNVQNIKWIVSLYNRLEQFSQCQISFLGYIIEFHESFGHIYLELLRFGSFISCFVVWLDGVIKWKHFPRYWPFVRGIHWSLVNSPHKGQLRGALMFSLICAWINGWVNNRDAGDLRRHRAHYDVIVKIVPE